MRGNNQENKMEKSKHTEEKSKRAEHKWRWEGKREEL